MANVQRYFSQVGRPNYSTKAPVQPNLNTANAIGQTADVANQFLQRYQQERYNNDLYDVDLAIKKKVNEFNEYLRTNPIVPAPGQTTIAAREKLWNEYAEKNIQKGIIEGIANPKLREDVSKAWASQYEDYRAKLVDEGITQDIRYMAAHRKDQIDGYVASKEYDKARQIWIDGANNGYWDAVTMEQGLHQVNVLEKVDELDGVPYKEAVKQVTESSLTKSEQAEAKQILSQKEQQRLKELEEERKRIQEQTTDSAIDEINENNISADLLNYRLSENGDWGKHLDTAHENMIRNAWKSKNQKDPDKSDKKALADLKYAATQPGATRKSLLAMAYDYGARRLITYDDQQKFVKSLNNDPKFKNYLLEKVHTWIKENKDLFGEDDTEIAANTAFITDNLYDMLYGDNISARDKFMENGFTEEDFNNLKKAWSTKATFKRIDDLATLREDNGNTSISRAEKIEQLAQEGRLFSRYITTALNRFIKNPYESVDDLKQEAKDLLGTDDSKMIDATVALGLIHREANRLFGIEVKEPNAVHGIDTATGLPTFTVYDTDSNGNRYVKTIYRLGYNPEEKEEQWQVYRNGDWIADPTKPIPNLRKTGTLGAIIGDVKTTIERARTINNADVRKEDKPSGDLLYGIDMNNLWKYTNGVK